MKQWILYALISMLFAGVTSVIAKKGMADISSELGLTVRTIFVFAFVLLFAAVAVPMKAWEGLRKENLLWLGVSAATTAVSWIFYYKAIKDGEVSTVALIDKGSIIIAVILAAVILKETITPRTICGVALMLGGLLVLVKR